MSRPSQDILATLEPDAAASLKLWVILNRALRAIEVHDRRDLERHGLHPTEFSVLELLYFKGPLPLGEIGNRVLLTSGSTTHVVDKLERRGLLARSTSSADRRVCHAGLTDEGRARIDACFQEHARVLAAAMAGLTTEEKAIAAALLKRLGRYASEQLPNRQISRREDN